jgi:hypothetical protein
MPALPSVMNTRRAATCRSANRSPSTHSDATDPAPSPQPSPGARAYATLPGRHPPAPARGCAAACVVRIPAAPLTWPLTFRPCRQSWPAATSAARVQLSHCRTRSTLWPSLMRTLAVLPRIVETCPLRRVKRDGGEFPFNLRIRQNNSHKISPPPGLVCACAKNGGPHIL